MEGRHDCGRPQQAVAGAGRNECLRTSESWRAIARSSFFPEGTRRPPGAEPRYKYGVAHLYAETGVPCLPIALNSGLFWPRRSSCRYPGTIGVEVLDPIPPGLEQESFFERLQREIEDATARLVSEGKRERTHIVRATLHVVSASRATARSSSARHRAVATSASCVPASRSASRCKPVSRYPSCSSAATVAMT